MVQGSNPGGVRFSTVQIGPGAHPASCTMGTGGSKLRPGLAADSSAPPSVVIMKE